MEEVEVDTEETLADGVLVEAVVMEAVDTEEDGNLAVEEDSVEAQAGNLVEEVDSEVVDYQDMAEVRAPAVGGKKINRQINKKCFLGLPKT